MYKEKQPIKFKGRYRNYVNDEHKDKPLFTIDLYHPTKCCSGARNILIFYVPL